MTPFWMLYLENGDPPRYRHQSLETARVEAERLALTHPGRKVWVLQSMQVVQLGTLVWEDIGEPGKLDGTLLEKEPFRYCRRCEEAVLDADDDVNCKECQKRPPIDDSLPF